MKVKRISKALGTRNNADSELQQLLLQRRRVGGKC